MLAEWSLITYWRGLTNGDPVAWIITVAVVALFAGGILWDNRRKDKSSSEPESERD